VRSLSKDEFLALVRERLGPSSLYKGHALVFVHGFNTSFEYALFRTAQIAYDIKFDGAPFLYSWPSKGALSSQDYSYDRESSGQAEPYLRQFLELVAHETGATSVSIIAHSMGSQLVLPVLRDLRYAAPPSVTISQVILAAPDVDRDAFENIAKEVAGVSRGVTVLAAGNDRALEISRRFWGGVPRAGDVPANGPIVVEGVDTIDVTAVSTLMFALNHSGFAERTALLSDIQQLIRTGLRPPDKRLPILELVKTAHGNYWRYPKQGQ
jgi:esterase/lipase superfamily enzyme